MSDLPILDPQPLQDLLDLGASDDLVQELLGIFKEDVPPRITVLKAALAAGDVGVTMREAHQLKGALGNMGLIRFGDLAARIEACAREGQLKAAAALAEGLPVAYDEALQALLTAFPES